MTTIKSINPATGDFIGEVPITTAAELKEAVARIKKFSPEWRIDIASRIKAIQSFRLKLLARKDDLLNLITREVGKPIGESNFEFDDSLGYLDWYLESAESLLSARITDQDSSSVHTLYYEPLGTAAAIIPWNFPLCNWIWAVIPNLLAGNVVILKHSEECPLSARLIEEIVQKSEIPNDALAHVYGDGQTGKFLSEQDVDLIWFTGSTDVGKKLYRQAANSFTRVLLELGGSAPGIVFSDVNVAEVVQSVYQARFFNCGQVCDGLKRLIVHESIASKVCDQLCEIIKSKVVGDPLDERTDLGPLVAKRQQLLIADQLSDAVARGAEVCVGGKIPQDCTGAFFEPTLVRQVSSDMRIWKEETFGPLLPVCTFTSEEEAVALANDTRYGLGAYVFTGDSDRAKRVAGRLHSGMVSINDISYVKPCNPFGGYKESGLGREHGPHGLYELCQTKIVAAPKQR